jgi:hypothetical protein
MAAPDAKWDSAFEAVPADTDDPEQGADNIRDTKLAVRQRFVREHEGSHGESTADKAYDGRHRAGSARALVVDADPATAGWPDDATDEDTLLYRALDTRDDGRLWFDSGDSWLPALRAQTDDDPETHGWVGYVREVFRWSWQGVIGTTLDVPRILVPHACTVIKVGAVLTNAPTGSAATLQVHKGESAAGICTAALSLAAGTGLAKASTATLDDTNKVLAADDTLRLEIATVGSTTPGSDLSVFVEVIVHP